jgi:hypothetical protein
MASGTGEECSSRSAVDPTITCPSLPSEAEPSTSTSEFSSSTASRRPLGAERWAILWKSTLTAPSIELTHSCASLAESAANCSAYWAYSASIRAIDGVIHGLGTTVNTVSDVYSVLAASTARCNGARPLLPAR